MIGVLDDINYHNKNAGYELNRQNKKLGNISNDTDR